MNPTRYLAGRIRRSINGPMWHGPAVAELLAGMSPADAAAHPIAGAHSVWELVLHLAAWAEISASRLDGDTLNLPSEEVQWPAVPDEVNGASWMKAQTRLAVSYEVLAVRALALPAERLLERVKEQEFTIAVMLDGVVEHATYHGGQIALLKRAQIALA